MRTLLHPAPRRDPIDAGSEVSSPARLLMIGDSITDQWGRQRPRVFARHGLVNRGIGGQTTRDILARFANELARTDAPALHLMAGLNDIAGNGGPIALSETQDNLSRMAGAAAEAGLRVLVASVTPAATIAWNPAARPIEPILSLNAWLRAFAQEAGATFVDYHAVLRTPDGGLRDGLGPDGSHLDARGYRLIEPVLLRAIGQEPAPPTLAERVSRLLGRAES